MQDKMSYNNQLITVKEAAEYLRLAKGTIYNLVCSSKLKSYKVGNGKKGSLRFTYRDLDNFIGKKYDD